MSPDKPSKQSDDNVEAQPNKQDDVTNVAKKTEHGGQPEAMETDNIEPPTEANPVDPGRRSVIETECNVDFNPKKKASALAELERYARVNCHNLLYLCEVAGEETGLVDRLKLVEEKLSTLVQMCQSILDYKTNNDNKTATTENDGQNGDDSNTQDTKPEPKTGKDANVDEVNETVTETGPTKTEIAGETADADFKTPTKTFPRRSPSSATPENRRRPQSRSRSPRYDHHQTNKKAGFALFFKRQDSNEDHKKCWLCERTDHYLTECMQYGCWLTRMLRMGETGVDPLCGSKHPGKPCRRSTNGRCIHCRARGHTAGLCPRRYPSSPETMNMYADLLRDLGGFQKSDGSWSLEAFYENDPEDNQPGPSSRSHRHH